MRQALMAIQTNAGATRSARTCKDLDLDIDVDTIWSQLVDANCGRVADRFQDVVELSANVLIFLTPNGVFKF